MRLTLSTALPSYFWGFTANEICPSTFVVTADSVWFVGNPEVMAEVALGHGGQRLRDNSVLGLTLGVWSDFTLGERAKFTECREFSGNLTPIKSSEIVL
jgi:hypothetical protein